MADLRTLAGVYRTESLFYETIQNKTRLTPIFTLKPKDHKGYKSLKKIYLAYNDVTEYDFAIGVFGQLEHWTRLCACAWFQSHLISWRAELELKMRSMAVKELVKAAKGPKGLVAAKWLAEAGWKPKKRGRPSKVEVAGERKMQGRLDKELDGHADRMGLTLDS